MHGTYIEVIKIVEGVETHFTACLKVFWLIKQKCANLLQFLRYAYIS